MSPKLFQILRHIIHNTLEGVWRLQNRTSNLQCEIHWWPCTLAKEKQYYRHDLLA